MKTSIRQENHWTVSSGLARPGWYGATVALVKVYRVYFIPAFHSNPVISFCIHPGQQATKRRVPGAGQQATKRRVPGAVRIVI
jgi:hypothetical protein